MKAKAYLSSILEKESDFFKRYLLNDNGEYGMQEIKYLFGQQPPLYK